MNTTTTNATYIVMCRTAKVRGRAAQYGPYHHLAIVELDPEWAADNPGREPTMISERARGVRRIVRDSGAIWSGGTTMRSKWCRTLKEYADECAVLNAREEIAEPELAMAA